jgi:hypothetical protein
MGLCASRPDVREPGPAQSPAAGDEAEAKRPTSASAVCVQDATGGLPAVARQQVQSAPPPTAEAVAQEVRYIADPGSTAWLVPPSVEPAGPASSPDAALGGLAEAAGPGASVAAQAQRPTGSGTGGQRQPAEAGLGPSAATLQQGGSQEAGFLMIGEQHSGQSGGGWSIQPTGFQFMPPQQLAREVAQLSWVSVGLAACRHGRMPWLHYVMCMCVAGMHAPLCQGSRCACGKQLHADAGCASSPTPGTCALRTLRIT